MIMRAPKPKPTSLRIVLSKRVKEVRCLECGELISWVTERMEREQPARARALLLAAHMTDAECELARSQA